jgi:hypothetical protein
MRWRSTQWRLSPTMRNDLDAEPSHPPPSFNRIHYFALQTLVVLRHEKTPKGRIYVQLLGVSSFLHRQSALGNWRPSYGPAPRPIKPQNRHVADTEPAISALPAL